VDWRRGRRGQRSLAWVVFVTLRVSVRERERARKNIQMGVLFVLEYYFFFGCVGAEE
jgi:hypothetical protein